MTHSEKPSIRQPSDKVTIRIGAIRIEIAADATSPRTAETAVFPRHRAGNGRFASSLSRPNGLDAAPAASIKIVSAASVNVVLLAIGDDEIAVVNVVRKITGLDLWEAKNLVQDAPSIIMEGLSSSKEAEAIKAALEGAGATVVLQATPRWRGNSQYAPQPTGAGHGA
jgi:ribosomal protein L7/L12